MGKLVKINETVLRRIIIEAATKLLDTDANDNFIIECINNEIKAANEYLNVYSMSVVYNSKYNFSDYYSDCIAVYQRNSVKTYGKIRIGINIPLLKSFIKKNKKKIQKQIEISIWHEIGHGIVEFLKGLRRKDTQCGTKIFRGKMLSDFKYIINDEEYYVEEFGNSMATNGDGIFSSIGDFLDDYNEQISAIRDQDGGSKWLQHFSTKQLKSPSENSGEFI